MLFFFLTVEEVAGGLDRAPLILLDKTPSLHPSVGRCSAAQALLIKTPICRVCWKCDVLGRILVKVDETHKDV